MGEIRSLNNSGIDRFDKYIRALGRGEVTAFPSEVLEDSNFSRSISTIEDNLSDVISLESKLSVALGLDKLFKSSGVIKETSDQGLWAWISAKFFFDVCDKDKEKKYSPGPSYKWVLDMDWQRFYRHLFAGPWRIYSLHSGRVELVEPLLQSAPTANTEIYEQLASSLEVIQSEGVLEAVRSLYWDSTANTFKRGHAGKGAGSLRRFSTFLNQIALTWDLNGVSGSELVELLPREFDRFRH